MANRLIALYDGTDCIDNFFVIETNAPKDRLKELELQCLYIELNGGSEEEVPSWIDELTDEGFTFDYVDECDNPDWKEWLAAEYPDVTEIYCGNIFETIYCNDRRYLKSIYAIISL